MPANNSKQFVRELIEAEFNSGFSFARRIPSTDTTIKKVLVQIEYDFSDASFRFSAPTVTAYLDWTEARLAFESSSYFVLAAELFKYCPNAA